MKMAKPDTDERKIAGMIAAEAIRTNKLDHILTYDKAWADRLGKRHETFDRIKNGIFNFSDEKFNSKEIDNFKSRLSYVLDLKLDMDYINEIIDSIRYINNYEEIYQKLEIVKKYLKNKLVL